MFQVVLHFLIRYGKLECGIGTLFFSLRWCFVGWLAVSS